MKKNRAALVQRWEIIRSATIALYGIACLSPAMSLKDRYAGDIQFGGQALMTGWVPPFTIPWSANIFLLAGLICGETGRYRAARILGVIGFFLSLTTVIFIAWYDLRVGYLLWIGTMLLLAGGAFGLEPRDVK